MHKKALFRRDFRGDHRRPLPPLESNPVQSRMETVWFKPRIGGTREIVASRKHRQHQQLPIGTGRFNFTSLDPGTISALKRPELLGTTRLRWTWPTFKFNR